MSIFKGFVIMELLRLLVWLGGLKGFVLKILYRSHVWVFRFMRGLRNLSLWTLKLRA